MKLRVFFIFTSLVLSPLLIADNAIPVGGAPDLNPDEAASGSLVLSDQELEFVLDDPSAKVKYDRCKELVGSSTLDDKVSECLWEGITVDKNGNPVDPRTVMLSESEQEKVAEALNAINNKGRKPANDEKKFESQDLGFLQKANNEPAFKALRDHMVKKLNETIYGKAERGKLKIADHRIYNELYKSQLSKNVIQAMSSYCLDADPANDFLVPSSDSKLNDVRKKNIATLKSTKMVSYIDPKTKQQAQKIEAQANFDSCIGNLKHICYKTGDYSGNSDADYSNSKTRACNVVTYIKQLKQNIVALSEIDKRYDELEKKSGGAGLRLDAKQELKTNSRTDKVEVITNMSSKEFIEESGFKEQTESELAEFQQCYTNKQQDPTQPPQWEFTGDEEACRKFLNENKDEASKFIAEADTRMRALEKDLKDTLDDSNDGVESYLKDQAYTEEEIKKITGDSQLVENVKDQIKKRYAAERAALIKSIAGKLKERTIESDDPKFDQGPEKGKLEQIGNELANRTQKYTELIHFNNIVTGYLETSDGQGNTGRNTTAAAMEIENSAYQDSRNPASGGGNPVDTDAIRAATEAAGVKPEIDEDKSNTLNQSDINELLQYEGVK